MISLQMTWSSSRERWKAALELFPLMSTFCWQSRLEKITSREGNGTGKKRGRRKPRAFKQKCWKKNPWLAALRRHETGGASLVRLPFKLAQIHTPKLPGSFHNPLSCCWRNPRGFRQTLCKCTPRISGEIRLRGVGLQKCFHLSPPPPLPTRLILHSYNSSKPSVSGFFFCLLLLLSKMPIKTRCYLLFAWSCWPMNYLLNVV